MKLIMLCDYGLDDAVATTYILDRADEFEEINILPVGGNFPLCVAFDNAKRLLSNYEKLKNVRLVDTSSIKQKEECVAHIHGNDGMGDILPRDYSCSINAEKYEDWIGGIDGDYTILSLGPCTVTLDILKRRGGMPLVIMGGNISEAPNYNGYEFNHGMDTEAFEETVKYPHVITTLDTGHHRLCDFFKIDLKGDTLFNVLEKRYVEMSRERGEEYCSIYDFTAALYLFRKDKFKVEVKEDKDGNKLSVLEYTGSEYII